MPRGTPNFLLLIHQLLRRYRANAGGAAGFFLEIISSSRSDSVTMHFSISKTFMEKMVTFKIHLASSLGGSFEREEGRVLHRTV
jgi:hypothetical protein